MKIRYWGLKEQIKELKMLARFTSRDHYLKKYYR